jgi:hypothetical protein
LFGVTFVMALLHLLGVGHPHGPELPAWGPDLWITFFVLVLPVWAASIHAATSQLELARIAARSRGMAKVMHLQAHRAARATSLEELARVARESDALMRLETREWWALLSFQDVKLHV